MRILTSIILALSLFLGATVQYSEGSTLTGLILFVLSVFFLSRIELSGGSGVKQADSLRRLMLPGGLFLVAIDLFVNIMGYGRSGFNTLDTMTLLAGISLMAYGGTQKEDHQKLGLFGSVLSISFILLYLTFYVLLKSHLYRFDHYFIMLPSAHLVRLFGINLEIVGTETLRIPGVSDLVVKIGGPCSGLYSMFLLIGIVVGYTVTEGRARVKTILGFAFLAGTIAYIGNIIRVSIIYIAGFFYGVDAMMTVHLHLGWIIFAVTSLGLFLILERGPFTLSK